MHAPHRAARILVVEDEAKLAQLLDDYLSAEGYRVHRVSDGLEAVPAFKEFAADVVLLDLMLPGKDGLQVCRDLRRFSPVPIIMLTARVEEIDRLLGLELGADDYVCKPFSPREVVARVRAILRRVRSGPSSAAVQGLQIDEARFDASIDGRSLELTPVEFRLLKMLATTPGRVFSRQQLLDGLYADHRVVTDRTVDSHVKNLRRKLQLASPERDLIRSIYGVGYKIES